VLVITTVLSVVVAPAGQARQQVQPKLWRTAKSLWRNKPLRVYILAIALPQVASGMVGALYFFFMGNYLDIVDKVAPVALGTGILSILSSVVWPFAMSRIGKHATLAIATFSTAVTLVAMAFIQPGPYAFPAMLILFGLSSLTASASNVGMSAIMADIVDYDELRTRQNSAGLFYSLNTVIQKFGITIGGALALILVGLFGFDPASNTNSESTMRGFFTVFIWIPLVLNLIAAMFAWRFPITRKRYGVIRRRLDQRKLREARIV